MRNQPEFIYALYGAAALGAIVVPVDPRIKADRLEFILNNSRSKGIIFSSEFMESIRLTLSNVPQVDVLV